MNSLSPMVKRNFIKARIYPSQKDVKIVGIGESKKNQVDINMQLLPEPSKKGSKKVESIDEIMDEALELQGFIESRKVFQAGSHYPMCLSVAHPQISDDPKRFFVLNPLMDKLVEEFGGCVVFNPKIIAKDRTSRVKSKEGCMSYQHRPAKKVKRFTKITAEYSVLVDPATKEVKQVTKDLDGAAAIVLQHELDHLNCKSIWV